MNIIKLYTRHGAIYVDSKQLNSERTILSIYTARGNKKAEVAKTVAERELASFGVHRANLFASPALAQADIDRLLKKSPRIHSVNAAYSRVTVGYVMQSAFFQKEIVMLFSKIKTADHELFTRWVVLGAMNKYWIDGAINDRAALFNAIELYKVADQSFPSGFAVFVAESGMDCDCVKYQHTAHKIDASMLSYYSEHDSIAKWADGAFWLAICDPNRLPVACSRDLALEAFEDGHSHVVYC